MNRKSWSNGEILKAYIIVMMLAAILVPGFYPRRQRHKDVCINYTEVQLQAINTYYNETVFYGALPKSMRITWENLEAFNEVGDVQKDSDGVWHIRLDRKYNPVGRQTILTMIHEDCHLVTWGQEFDDHGPKFEACMLRVAESGALHDVW